MKVTGKTTNRIIANLALLALFGGVLIPALVPLAAADEQGVSVESKSMESNGVAIVIEASKTLLESNEPLTLRITFRNTTDRVIWLPPPLYSNWTLHSEDTSTGQSFTGASTRYGGSMGLPQRPPVRLQPRESQTFVVAFKKFGFVEGDVDDHAARNELFEKGKKLRPDAPGLAEVPLLPPAGVYRLTAEIRTPADYRQAIAITLANTPLCKKQATDAKNEDYEFHDNECRINSLPDDFDSASLWKTDVLRSNSIEIKVAVPKN